jgi:hypothetical protein
MKTVVKLSLFLSALTFCTLHSTEKAILLDSPFSLQEISARQEGDILFREKHGFSTRGEESYLSLPGELLNAEEGTIELLIHGNLPSGSLLWIKGKSFSFNSYPMYHHMLTTRYAGKGFDRRVNALVNPQGGWLVGEYWHHIAYVWGEEGYKVFVNGKQVASEEKGAVSFTKDEEIRLGHKTDGNILYGKILISDRKKESFITPVAQRQKKIEDAVNKLSRQNDFFIVPLLPDEKVFPERAKLKMLSSNFLNSLGSQPPAIELQGLKNEIESFQVVIIPGRKEALERISLATTPLTSSEGQIPAEAIEIYVVGYVKSQGDNWFPDPLLPLFDFNIPENEVRTLWANIKIPPETAPGKYKGSITITPEGLSTVKVPIEMEVGKVIFPVRVSLRSAIGFGRGWWEKFYSKNFPALYNKDNGISIYKNYIDFFLSRHLSPAFIGYSGIKIAESDGEADYDFSGTEEIIQYAIDRGLTSFCIGRFDRGFKSFGAVHPYFGKTEDEETMKKRIEKFLVQYTGYLKEKGWLKDSFVWAWDEPPEKVFPVLKETMQFVRQVCPDIKKLCTVSPPKEELVGFVDIWTPHLVTRNIEPLKRVVEMAGERGEAWWYTSGYPTRPTAWNDGIWLYNMHHLGGPNCFVDYPGIDGRIIFWLTWKWEIEGYLKTDVVSWYGGVAEDPIDLTDVKTQWNINPGIYGHRYGHLLLVYPGHNGSPISSLRIENMREGIEDHEYFYLLREAKKILEDSGADKKVIAEIDEAITIPADILGDRYLGEYTLDSERLYNKRTELFRLLNKHSETVQKIISER